MTVEQLDKISAQRLEDVDIDTLVEVNSIKYADGMPVEKKVAGMIAKTGNRSSPAHSCTADCRTLFGQ